MSGVLFVRNRQRERGVDVRYLRRIVQSLLAEQLGLKQFDLGIYLVSAPVITSINQTYLRHSGPTDVITFDYCDPRRPEWIGGEIFICLDEALTQAKRFQTSWQSELVRYIVHGALHLSGFDDRTPPLRRRMKREEDRLLRELASNFDLRKVAFTPKLVR